MSFKYLKKTNLLFSYLLLSYFLGIFCQDDSSMTGSSYYSTDTWVTSFNSSNESSTSSTPLTETITSTETSTLFKTTTPKIIVITEIINTNEYLDDYSTTNIVILAVVLPIIWIVIFIGIIRFCRSRQRFRRRSDDDESRITMESVQSKDENLI